MFRYKRGALPRVSKIDLSRRFGRIVSIFAVGLVDAKNHEARVKIVRHIATRRRHRMNAIEVTHLAQVGSQARVQFVHNFVRVSLQLFGAVFGEFRDSRLRRIPVARTVLIEVGRGCRKSSQGIAEHCRGFTRHHTAEFDASVLDAPIGGARRGRGAQVDGSRHAPAGGELAKVRHLAIQPQRQGAGTVNVFLDDRHPIVRKVARQFELHTRIVDWNVGGQDEWVLIALLPQAVNHCRHQPQHAARALKFHQR